MGGCGSDVAGWRGLDLEHVEADPVGVEVGVDQPGDDEPAFGVDDVGAGRSCAAQAGDDPVGEMDRRLDDVVGSRVEQPSVLDRQPA